VQLRGSPTYGRNILPPCSGSNLKLPIFSARFLFDLFFFTLNLKAMGSSETSDHLRTTYQPGKLTLYTHLRENPETTNFMNLISFLFLLNTSRMKSHSLLPIYETPCESHTPRSLCRSCREQVVFGVIACRKVDWTF
jgi:hypothetical protein